MPGAPDANGIWQYAPDDPRTPFDDTLNLGQSSTSIAVGQLKSRVTAVEGKQAPTGAASAAVAATGWSLSTNIGVKIGKTAFVNFTFTRTGSAITVPSDGNVSNTLMASLAAGFAILNAMGGCGLSSTHTGPLASAYINTAGDIYLAAVAPGSTIPTGAAFSFFGTYPLA